MLRQMLDMTSPSNSPLLDPEILETVSSTKGQALADGARLWMQDALRALYGAQTESPLKIGRDIACTPGEVVFRNHLLELIQYGPQTETVHPEPILIVPARIMKCYILDLSPQNFLINWLVAQGHTVFCISWVNPTPELANLSLDEHRSDGVMAAIDAVTQILPETPIQTCGYCLGGTILSIAAATMARDGDAPLASVTMLAAQKDFSEAGKLLLFLDESQLAFLHDMMAENGTLDGKQMAGAFQALRAEDLIWTRATRRYLMGIEDRLSAGRFAVDDKVIALRDTRVPIFTVGTESDQIAPWHSVYKIALFTETELTFCLTSGGHNGGIVSQPAHPNRHYRIACRKPGDLYTDPESWFAQHAEKEGSWWQE